MPDRIKEAVIQHAVQPVVDAAIAEASLPASSAGGQRAAQESRQTHEVAMDATAREGTAATGRQEERDRVSQGQRNINLMWETTQMRVALLVGIGFMLANIAVVLSVLYRLLFIDRAGMDPSNLALLVGLLGQSLGSLAATMSLVIGFYFARTNHTKTGGVSADDKGR